MTDHKSCTLQWKQRQFQRTISLNQKSNVASFRMAPGFRQFEAYEVTAGFDDNYDSDPLISQEAAIIENEEGATT